MGIHGVRVTEGALGAPPINLPDISTIGLIGTAPGIDVDGDFGENGRPKYQKPILITSLGDVPTSQLGDEGTLPDAFAGIYAQTRAKTVFVVIPEFAAAAAMAGIDDADYLEAATVFGTTTSAKEFKVIEVDEGFEIIINTATWDTTDQASLLALELGQALTVAATSGTDWLYEITGVPIEDTTAGTITILVSLETEGTAFVTTADEYTLSAAALSGSDAESKTRAAAIGVQADLTGIYGLLSAESEVGTRPAIILAPDFDTGSGDSVTANALGAAMQTVAARLRAIAIIDGPSTTHAASVTDFPEQYGGDRTYLVDPKVKVTDADAALGYSLKAASPYVAGVIVKSDVDRGWWNSPSNQLIYGILGTSRSIDFVMGDPASRAQLMNDEAVTTIINVDGGYRLWGNETPSSGDRAPWKFINVRRTADVLYKAVQDNHLWAVDRGITKTYFDAVADGVNAFIRTLIQKEALIGGRCYPDGELNTEANIALGEVYFNVEYTPTYPAQTVNFQVNLTTRDLATLVA